MARIKQMNRTALLDRMRKLQKKMRACGKQMQLQSNEGFELFEHGAELTNASDTVGDWLAVLENPDFIDEIEHQNR